MRISDWSSDVCSSDLSDLRNLPIYTPQGSQITLGTVAKVQVTDGPPMLKSENARLSGWVYVDVRGRDMAAVVGDLREKISKGVQLESRSEEHTSELQSLMRISYAVFCLKKNTKKTEVQNQIN